jgi:hypothetical protein
MLDYGSMMRCTFVFAELHGGIALKLMVDDRKE